MKAARAEAPLVVALLLGFAAAACGSREYHATTVTSVAQPVSFRHKRHLDYFTSGKHPEEQIKMHAAVLDFDEEDVPEELLNGQCTECHEPGLVDVPSCAGCHVLFEDEALRARREIRACIGCHRGAWTGGVASIPSATVCHSCHGTEPRTQSREEARLREEYLARGKDIPWMQINTLSPCVYFSHKAHVRYAVHECTRCHEDMREQDASPTKASVFSMDGCMRCHEESGATNECLTCHK